MDYGLRWQIPFRTLDDTERTIKIYDADYSGDVTTLEGAETPLETQETTDDDLLCPIRTQTGYLNVIDNGDLSGLMPTNNTQHYVELVEANTVLWHGFMKAAAYADAWDVTPKVVKFPVMSYLELLGSIDMGRTDTNLAMIGELIHEAATNMDGHDWAAVNYIYFPCEFGTDATDWWKVLQMQVSRYNFFRTTNGENTDDPDWSKWETISYKELLTQICTFFGWTLREEPMQWSFISTKTNRYFKIGVTALGNIASLNSLTVTEEEETSVAIGDMELDGVDHSSDLLQGFRTFEVSAKLNTVSDVEGIDIDLTGKSYVRLKTESRVDSDDTEITRTLIFDTGQDNYFQSADRAPMYLYAWYGETVQGQDDLHWIRLPYDTAVDTVSNVDGYVLAQLCKYDQYKQSDVDNNTKVSYSYTAGILILQSVPQDAQMQLTDGSVPVVTIIGSILPAIMDGCLDLDFNYSKVTSSTFGNITANVEVELQVGDFYWDGTAWTTTESTFYVPVKDGVILSNKTLAMAYEEASHWVIPISSMIYGEVRLTIYNNPELSITGYGSLLLHGISLAYCKTETVTQEKASDTNHYYAVADNGFSARKEIDLELATRRDGGAGHALLVYNGAMVNGTTFPQGRFEEYLLGNLKRLFGRYVEMLTLQVRAVSLTPRTRVTRSGTTYQVISVARNWGDDGQTVIVEALPS